MNERKNFRLRYSGVAKAVYLACLGMAAQQAVAQPAEEEITITGSRLISSGVNTPTPVTAVSGADLQAMAPTTLIESLRMKLNSPSLLCSSGAIHTTY